MKPISEIVREFVGTHNGVGINRIFSHVCTAYRGEASRGDIRLGLNGAINDGIKSGLFAVDIVDIGAGEHVLVLSPGPQQD